MLNFTVGPVMSSEEVLQIGAQNSPYFRTSEFSNVMLESEKILLEFLNAPINSRCVFLTTSGTGAMESSVMNILNSQDKVLVVNGGSFGNRFVELCRIHHLNFTEIPISFGKQIKESDLVPFESKGYTAFLINMDETSSATLYDMKLVSDFCKRNNILLIVDAISSFIADEIDMTALNSAAVIIGSQKALAVHPGVSVIALSPTAIERITKNKEKCMYLSLKLALENMDRGQTPFTPAVSTLLEINARLKSIRDNGGIDVERAIIAQRASEFRSFIKALPFEFASESMSNTVTSLIPLNVGAKSIINTMKEEYNIWLCPNGGEIADKVFRVGHIGDISDNDLQKLYNAFSDMFTKGLI